MRGGGSRCSLDSLCQVSVSYVIGTRTVTLAIAGLHDCMVQILSLVYANKTHTQSTP